jgi:cell wall-associated NlpC family hydrolase
MSLSSRSRLLAFALSVVTGALVLTWPATAEVGDASLAARATERTVPEAPPYPRAPGKPKPKPKGERAARIALRAVGVPYRWAGESPATGFDCSGLVRWAYGRVGVDLPHSSYALYGVGRRVPMSRLVPGDVLFFEGLGHVGIYVGKGRMVHAPETGRSVEVVALGASSYGPRAIGARRVASG